MLGAIAGDIIGSVHEGAGTKTRNFPLFVPGSRFTDDTVLTVAVGDHLLGGGDYVNLFHAWCHAHPHAGYGGRFIQWALGREREPYGSWGNGSAMRVSPVGTALDSLDDVLEEARRSARVTHNHPEGVRGAQAVAAAVFLARTGMDKAGIRRTIEERFGYDLGRRLDDIRSAYRFDVSCQGSVPESLIAFLESQDYDSAVRNAVSLGGDADTMACIAGGVAEAYYGGVPEPIRNRAMALLTPDLREVVERFYDRFGGRLTRS
jgi:ADP-ribosylglycohydrolase